MSFWFLSTSFSKKHISQVLTHSKRWQTYCGIFWTWSYYKVIEWVPLDVQNISFVPTYFGIMWVKLACLEKKKYIIKASRGITGHFQGSSRKKFSACCPPNALGALCLLKMEFLLSLLKSWWYHHKGEKVCQVFPRTCCCEKISMHAYTFGRQYKVQTPKSNLEEKHLWMRWIFDIF